MTHLTVVPWPGNAPLTDLPAKLRELADRIESEDYGPYDQLIVVARPEDDNTPEIFLFGGTIQIHTLSGVLFHAAQMVLGGNTMP